MKKIGFYTFLSAFLTVIACKKPVETPITGDAAFYKYIVKEGEKVVFESKQIDNDTAMLLVEDVTDKQDRQSLLMKNIKQLGVNDSTLFDLPNGQKGYLKLFKIVKAKDFPMYIAESNRKQQAFESQLQKIKADVQAQMPSYQKRRNIVQDSTILMAKQYGLGQLTSAIKTLPSGVQYVILKGKGEVKAANRRWVWFNYCGVLSNGTVLDNSFGGLPAMTNLSEYKLLESLEKGAASFDSGDTILFIIPPQLAYGDKQMGIAPPNSTLIFWVEVLHSVEM